MKEEYLKWPWGINDTIENLKEIKKNLQYTALNKNMDGKGTQDFQEIGYDFDRAIKALEKNRWIPVIEKLPGLTDVLGSVVHINKNLRREEAVMLVRHYGNGVFMDLDLRRRRVIAWMPLQEPYEAEIKLCCEKCGNKEAYERPDLPGTPVFCDRCYGKEIYGERNCEYCDNSYVRGGRMHCRAEKCDPVYDSKV